MAKDHPWLGVGPDNFLYAYRTRYVLPGGWEELNLSHPHNLVLDLVDAIGAGGAWCGSLGHPRWPPPCLACWCPGPWDDAYWPLALGLLGGLAATVAHGLIDNSLFLVDLMALFMLAWGCCRGWGISESAEDAANAIAA